MQIVIDIPEKLYQSVQDETYCGSLYEELKNGTPLHISADGTLTITVDDAMKVGRVLVQDNKHKGGLFYADSN